jgi:hypothetical protein|tara:strand:- start:76 stop:573 length:498 start_codon:yes stop_codon:yes gene_type:complete
MPWIEPDFIIQAKCDTCGHTDEFGWDDRHERNYPKDHGWGGAYDRESWLAFVDSVPPEERTEPMKADPKHIPEHRDAVLCPKCLEKMPAGWIDRFGKVEEALWKAKRKAKLARELMDHPPELVEAHEVMGTMPDEDLAKMLGVSTRSVGRYRRKHDIKPFPRDLL